jgi:hypothetical protein
VHYKIIAPVKCVGVSNKSKPSKILNLKQYMNQKENPQLILIQHETGNPFATHLFKELNLKRSTL